MWVDPLPSAMTNQLSTLLDTARKAADAAAAVHKDQAASVGIADAREKGRADYVSATDLAAQEACVHPAHSKTSFAACPAVSKL